MRRREFLRAGAMAVPALAAQGSIRPVKSCILLVLTGGPSQVDTFDPKPEAPSEVRSPFGAIGTTVAGMQVSGLLPMLAREAKKFALVRSVWRDGESLHETGLQRALTGRAFAGGIEYPYIGSVMQVWNGARHVIVPGPLGQVGANLPSGQGAGFPGERYAPKYMSPADVICGEPEGVQARYGSGLFGQSCLAARVLVETGVGCVTVNMADTVFGADSWDAHGYSPFGTMAMVRDRVGPAFDRAASALISDLDSRGLLETTLVMTVSEFGRSPRLNPTGGRDHWTGCWSVLLAGGGVEGGQVYGASDAVGGEPVDRAVTPESLVATVYRAVGVPLDLRVGEVPVVPMGTSPVLL